MDTGVVFSMMGNPVTDDMSQALYLQTKIDTQSTGVVERLSNGETDAVLKDYNAHPVDEETLRKALLEENNHGKEVIVRRILLDSIRSMIPVQTLDVCLHEFSSAEEEVQQIASTDAEQAQAIQISREKLKFMVQALKTAVFRRHDEWLSGEQFSENISVVDRYPGILPRLGLTSVVGQTPERVSSLHNHRFLEKKARECHKQANSTPETLKDLSFSDDEMSKIQQMDSEGQTLIKERLLINYNIPIAMEELQEMVTQLSEELSGLDRASIESKTIGVYGGAFDITKEGLQSSIAALKVEIARQRSVVSEV